MSEKQKVEYETDYTADIRCASCGALLAKKAKVTHGTIEIKCHRCKMINNIGFTS